MIGKCCYCIWWGTLLLKIFSDAITLNVALRQSGKFCDADILEKVFDGDTNYKNSIFMDAGGCLASTAYLVVTLKNPTSIQFVVVFHGETHNNLLDFFMVDMYLGVDLQTCGHYSQKTEVLGRGMRVNCEDINRLYNFIRVFTKEVGSYDIAEFEAHTFAVENETYVMLHQGCYAEFKGSTAEISLEDCQKKCFDENNIFVAIKANRICSCGSDLEEETILDNKDCDLKCPGQERFCGGENSFSVYMIKVPLPTVLSCRQTRTSDSSSAKKMNLTIETCLQECSEQLYFATLLGDHCVCLDSVPSSPAIAYGTNCTTPCSGDATRLCGGETGMNVMRTCARRNSKLTCENIFRCKDGYDMFGVCKSGCKSGYVGKHCLQKVDQDTVNGQDLGLTTAGDGTDDIKKSEKFMETLKMILLIVTVLSSAICCYGMTRKREKSVHSEGSQTSAGASQVPPEEPSQAPPAEP